MIAKIIPLKKLPGNFFVFDYEVPIFLQETIRPGQMVKIEFRKKQIYGIVYKIEQKTEIKNIKTLSEIVNPEFFLTEEDLEFYLKISQIYKNAIANILKMALAPLQKNKLKKIELKTRKKQKNKKENRQYFLYEDEIEHQKLYKNLDSQKKTLIVIPEIRFGASILNLIPKKLHKQTIFWHSELSDKEKFTNWFLLRNQEKAIVIGTRASLLLPPSFFDEIIIDFEHDENHKHWEGSPRFSDKDLADLIFNLQNKKLTFASYSPSFEKYYEIGKENLKINRKLNSQKILFSNQTEKPIIISNLNKQRGKETKSFLSFEIEEKLLQQLTDKSKNDIFIYLNRKTNSTFVNCQKCFYTPLCPDTERNLLYNRVENILYSPVSDYKTKYEKLCPRCGSPLFLNEELSTLSLEKYLKTILKNPNYQIIRIDSEQTDFSIDENKNQIYIGTEKTLSIIDWKRTKTFLILDIDRQLSIPEFGLTEKIWQTLAEINYFRDPNSLVMIQTKNPENVFFKSLGEKDRIYRTELNLRKKLFYPPYSFLVKYFFGALDKKEAKEKCQFNYEKIKNILTNKKINVKLTPVYEMQANFSHGKNYYAFNLRLPKKDYLENLKIINEYIDSDLKIDPNPNSLLTP
ncbi:MAG: hypothetical protein WC414_04230 [Patescibacteria group bacterium]